ncbi:hypothetical protein Esti_005670 [Eimeria stiedai]
MRLHECCFPLAAATAAATAAAPFAAAVAPAAVADKENQLGLSVCSLSPADRGLTARPARSCPCLLLGALDGSSERATAAAPLAVCCSCCSRVSVQFCPSIDPFYPLLPRLQNHRNPVSRGAGSASLPPLPLLLLLLLLIFFAWCLPRWLLAAARASKRGGPSRAPRGPLCRNNMNLCIQRRLVGALASRSSQRAAGLGPSFRQWIKQDMQPQQLQQQLLQHLAASVYAQSSWLPKRLFHGASGGHMVVDCPPMGDSITEGTLLEWKHGVGSYVKEGALLAVVETDKVSVEINASASGRIAKSHAAPGETVFVGQPLYELDLTAVPTKEEEARTAQSPAAGAAAPAAAAAPPPPEAPAQRPAAAAPSPAAPARAAAAHTVPPAAFAAPRPPVAAAKPPMGERGERRVRQQPASSCVSVTLCACMGPCGELCPLCVQCDMGSLMALRSDLNEAFLAKHGVKMGFVSAFMVASSLALQAFPIVNAVIDGQEVVYRDAVDISVAVAAPTGLLVPVIRNCDTKTWAQIESELVTMAKKARNNQIALEDMIGGTFTISNGGVYGSMMGTPIINPPQSAILGKSIVAAGAAAAAATAGGAAVLAAAGVAAAAVAAPASALAAATLAAFVPRHARCNEQTSGPRQPNRHPPYHVSLSLEVSLHSLLFLTAPVPLQPTLISSSSGSSRSRSVRCMRFACRYLALTYDHRLIDGREAVLFLSAIRDYIQDPRKMLLGL